MKQDEMVSWECNNKIRHKSDDQKLFKEMWRESNDNVFINLFDTLIILNHKLLIVCLSCYINNNINHSFIRPNVLLMNFFFKSTKLYNLNYRKNGLSVTVFSIHQSKTKRWSEKMGSVCSIPSSLSTD